MASFIGSESPLVPLKCSLRLRIKFILPISPTPLLSPAASCLWYLRFFAGGWTAHELCLSKYNSAIWSCLRYVKCNVISCSNFNVLLLVSLYSSFIVFCTNQITSERVFDESTALNVQLTWWKCSNLPEQVVHKAPNRLMMCDVCVMLWNLAKQKSLLQTGENKVWQRPCSLQRSSSRFVSVCLTHQTALLGNKRVKGSQVAVSVFA